MTVSTIISSYSFDTFSEKTPQDEESLCLGWGTFSHIQVEASYPLWYMNALKLTKNNVTNDSAMHCSFKWITEKKPLILFFNTLSPPGTSLYWYYFLPEGLKIMPSSVMAG